MVVRSGPGVRESLTEEGMSELKPESGVGEVSPRAGVVCGAEMA